MSSNSDMRRMFQKRDAARKYHHAVWLALVQAKPKDWQACAVEVTYTYRAFRGCIGYQPKDGDNAIAALKKAQDALATARVVPSDTRKFVRLGPLTLLTTVAECGGAAGVTMHIRRIP